MGLLLTACNRGGDAAAGDSGAPDDGCTVAYSQGSLSGEWRVANSEDMKAQVEAAGCEFIQISADDDVAKQLQDVNDLLAKQPDLLVVAPVQYEPLAPVPGLAEAAGVPLIVVDRELPGTPGEGQYKALITIDFVESGVKVAESLVQGLTEKNGEPRGNVLHITGTTGSSPVIDEQEGIDQVLADNPGIQIVGSCDGLYAAEPGRSCMEDFLQRFDAGQIDGVIADNDEMALGAIQAIKAAGRTELLPWVWGKDAQRTALEAMLAGEMYYTISTPPQYGAITMDTWLKIQDDSLEDPVVLIPKTEFTLDDEDAIQTAIDTLTEQNMNCCSE
ncbi:substrate-binding domain-containing protein [Microbacterium sp. Marseille-Q6648]|uniref:substrate-binding domain-containing protein n=1 Tax=Microbacterium sp. Marseille-Q6648 TaxID=2937991 RepID=UPI00203EC9AE|nr:substrate-binding domain-containing protein [Microbacterium sp. Marseille-Q6648]